MNSCLWRRTRNPGCPQGRSVHALIRIWLPERSSGIAAESDHIWDHHGDEKEENQPGRLAQPPCPSLECDGQTTWQIHLTFVYVVAVATEEYLEYVPSVPLPVPWHLHPFDRGWKVTLLLHTFQCEEATPCLTVLRDDLLRGS